MIVSKFLIKLFIDVQPKQRPRFGKNGSVYTPKETKQCMDALSILYKSYLIKTNKKMMPKGKPLKLSFKIFTKRSRGSDIDNYLKTIMDAGNGILWHDDSWIEKICLGEMVFKADVPLLLLKVEAI